MVVDDNLPARQIIQLLLQQMSFEVTPVDSGLSALSALEAADEAGMPYRLVLIDWMMPDMDGGEVARRIAGLGLQAPPKCILVTGNSGPEVVEAAHEIGISDVVLKPVSASELFEAVMRTLGGGGGPENVPARPGVASAGEPSVAAEPPAATAIAVRDTAPSPPVATGDWQAIRGRLIELLRDDDMDCVPLFDAHEPLTRDALGDGYPAFESAMRAFDFPAALEALGGSAQG